MKYFNKILLGACIIGTSFAGLATHLDRPHSFHETAYVGTWDNNECHKKALSLDLYFMLSPEDAEEMSHDLDDFHNDPDDLVDMFADIISVDDIKHGNYDCVLMTIKVDNNTVLEIEGQVHLNYRKDEVGSVDPVRVLVDNR